ncbi:DNA polymerase-3 subunit gamma/tau [Pustulibacterium marinum]|uniref:DNA polymerase III subunit gamma/tau n=1 Tax=Pustulibacterium marinum TaxID=1224947 RepID=A0A1I7G2P0_9FLAO|nr:DNA polymerase III subunit gamma/tau [Pustulibacterium marinum]SFU42712.1 DNA polymerase-3 subunit gamma/tau [Pustulibacterium marinum]
MEHFVVSARKYRPQTFKDVVGQKAITNTLLNAIDNNHLAQALLFCGPRGVGKTTCARILAKMINSDGTEREDEDFAFNIFELDAASNNSVDDIRNLIDQVRIPPQVGKYKVYIIDEVHMLSSAAFNAFLKTLEEPPKHAIFILATTEKHKIIPTILSRCQIFDFKRITVTDAKEYLKYIAEEQGIEAEDDALHVIAQKADGAMRDALSIFDRVVSFSGKYLTRQAVTENLNVLDFETYFTATEFILENKIPDLMLQFNEILSRGFDAHHFVSGLASHFRDLMVCKNEATIPLLEVGEEAQQKYAEQSRKTSMPFLLEALKLANECDLNYKTSKNQRLLIELCLMQLASITYDGEKKNGKPFIIPATFFINTEKVPVKEVAPTNAIPPTITETTTPQAVKEPIPTPVSKPAAPKIDLKNMPKGVSGFSLKSIKAKKELEKNRVEDIVDEENLPREKFTEEEMQEYWNKYVAKLEKDGKKIMASNLTVDTPRMKNPTTIWIESPNDGIKHDIINQQNALLAYLKKKLKNYDISLHITVNEETAKKFIFTPQEKYEKLRETNPVIDLLRKEFDLDL